MTRELVILADLEPPAAEWTKAATALLGSGDVVQFVGGMQHVVDRDGYPIVSWWPAREVANSREAVEELGEIGGSSRFWIDVCVPDTDSAHGLAIAMQVAESASGRVVARA